MAGTLNMEWKKFLLFNALGAVSWIITVSLTGYFVAKKFELLAGYVKKVPWGVSVGLLTVGYVI